MRFEYDLIILGGGIIGLAAALSMEKIGYRVAVIDAKAFPQAKTLQGPKTQSLTARAYAINSASKQLFEKIGVWSLLDPSCLSPYRSMHIWDALNQETIHFDSKLITENHLGHILEDIYLRRALLTKIEQCDNITLISKQTIDTIVEGKDRISLSNSEATWSASLLMIADGAHSPALTLLNIPVTHWPYHQEAIVALVETEKPHNQTAYQVFLPTGPLAFLPLSDPNYCSIVWSCTTPYAKERLGLPEEEFNQRITEAFESHLGAVRLKGLRSSFPLHMRHTKQYCGTRWVVLGDAAHSIHPLAGLGMNIGLADIQTFLNCINPEKPQLTQKAFLTYQRQRKNALYPIITGMEALKWLFLNPFPPIVQLRKLGLKFCNQSSFLKKLFINLANTV